MSTGVSLQLPVLFDISAGATVFGEDVSGVDIFDAHLKFTLASGNASVIRTQFRNILYADAPEGDVSGVLFYTNAGADGATVSTAIQSAILNGDLKQAGGTTYGTGYDPSGSEGTSSSAPGGTDWDKRYQAPGIPLPNFADALTEGWKAAGTSQQYYTDPICDGNGTRFGRVLIRLMATSLMGHPFAQAFIKNESEIMADISDCDIGSQITTKLFKGTRPGSATVQDISQVSVALATDSDEQHASTISTKADGIHNDILQQLYEQLLGSAPDRFDLSSNGSFGDDVSGNNADSDTVNPRRLPFRTSDTMSFYFRPRVALSIDGASSVTPETVNDASDNTVDNEDAVGSSYSALSKGLTSIFFNPRHRWISHTTQIAGYANGDGANVATEKQLGHCDASGNVLMTGTNLVHDSTSKIYFDAHVWRILVTL